MDVDLGQLRKETLSDRMADNYWHRAMFLVAKVDNQYGANKYTAMIWNLQHVYHPQAAVRLR